MSIPADQILEGAAVKAYAHDTVLDDEDSRPTSPVPPADVPWFRSTRFQAAVLAGVFFCGPGMYGSLNALGAGGLRTPTLVNITSGMSYGMNFVFAFLTGVLVNIFGERIVLSVGVVGFGLYAAALYSNSRYGTIWAMYATSALQGFTTAILWVVQAAIMLAYPEPEFRGRFIAIWYGSISVGQLVGGTISLALNVTNDKAGKVSTVTYIPLIALACLGPFIALLLSPPDKVVRRDGLPVKKSKQPSAWQELKRMVLLLPLIIFSQWFLSYNSTFTAVYHSVRGRALIAFLNPIVGVLGTLVAGWFLDTGRFRPSQKFRWAYYSLYIAFTAVWVWATVVQWWYSKTNPKGLDWKQGEYYASALWILAFSFVDHGFQVFMYALVGTLTDDIDELARYTGMLKAVNTGGAALGYAVQVKWSMMGAECILLVLWVIQIIPTWFVVREVKDEHEHRSAEKTTTGQDTLVEKDAVVPK
ncbi:Notoamide biosynthesis cluster protein O' [Exophiala dermatitidis]